MTSAIGGVRDGEEILAFLQYRESKHKLRLLNKYGSKVLVKMDPESGERSVELRFLNPKYLSENALKTFDKLRKDAEGDDEVRAQMAREQIKAGIVDTVPVEKLEGLLSRIIQDQGGPKGPQLICY